MRLASNVDILTCVMQEKACAVRVIARNAASGARAYGWHHDLSDEEILERLLALNLARAEGDVTSARDQ